MYFCLNTLPILQQNNEKYYLFYEFGTRAEYSFMVLS